MQQRDRAELLDTRALPRAEVEKSLRDIARINALTGADFAFGRAFGPLLHDGDMVLDLGCGGGQTLQNLEKWARKRQVALQLVGLDINASHLSAARQNLPTSTALVRGDAFQLPLGNQSVDWVVSTLFLHHFRPPQIAAILGECQRVARRGFLMNDLVRDARSLWLFRVFRPILARSWITRHDAVASIERGYTRDEMARIVMPLGARVEAPLPFRQFVRWEREPGMKSA